jgi:predicted nuclease with TOPRIM domain
MEEINEYLKTVEAELTEIKAKVENNPEAVNQYGSRLSELFDELVEQISKININKL